MIKISANEGVKKRRPIHILGELLWYKAERKAYVHKIENMNKKLIRLQIELVESLIQEDKERSG